MPVQRVDDPFDCPALSDSVRALARRGQLAHHRKGLLLIQEGSFGDTLYIMLAGRVRAFSSGDKGRQIIYGDYGPGEYLGEISLDGGPRSASVVTLEHCVCSVVTRNTLREYIAEHPEFAFELLAKVIRRARAATMTARQLALNDVYGRLVLTLNMLAKVLPDGVRVVEPRPTHQELAGRLGCSREMVSRLLKDLDLGGYTLTDGRQLLLLKPLPSRW
jgi:CRP/FNR family cyclic AMP-dependent transcriptional regulator